MKNTLKRLLDSAKTGNLKYVLRNYLNYNFPVHFVKNGDIQNLLVLEKNYKLLRKNYWGYLKQINTSNLQETKSDKVFTVWLQGYDAAPDLSKACINSVFRTFGREIVTFITLENIEQYIHIPSHIMEKWRKGIISYVHLCDYIQIALLAEHGGTWFDATVMILPGKIPPYFFDSPFFAFDNSYRNSPVCISSWFMSSYANGKIVTVVKKLLEEYWRRENGAYHYLILHLFFKMAFEMYPDEWARMPKFSNIQAHMLAHEVFTPHHGKRVEQIADMCPIQKLSNKFSLPNQFVGTYYDMLIKKGEITK